MMGDIYIGSYLMYKDGQHIHGAFDLAAKNEDEAIGKAYRIVKERYPPREGYRGHHVVVARITTDNIRKWAKIIGDSNE